MKVDYCLMQLKLHLINRYKKQDFKQEQEIAGAKIGQQVASDLLSLEADKEKDAVKDFKTGIDISKGITKR